MSCLDRVGHTHRRAAFFFISFFSTVIVACDLLPNPQRIEVSIRLNSTHMGDSAFYPNPAIVNLGGHVVWKNNDDFIHSIVGDAEEGICAFKSEAINQGMTFKKVFSKPVTCNYYCGIHGRTMRGKIVVR